MLPNLTLNDISFKKMGDSSVQVRFNDGYFFFQCIGARFSRKRSVFIYGYRFHWSNLKLLFMVRKVILFSNLQFYFKSTGKFDQ